MISRQGPLDAAKSICYMILVLPCQQTHRGPAVALGPASLCVGVRPKMPVLPFLLPFGLLQSSVGRPSFFASCVKGVEQVLATELSTAVIGAEDVQVGHLGVHFSGTLDVGARAVLWSRTALRVMEVIDIVDDVHDAESLYDVARAVEWADYLAGPSQTISVQAVLGAQRATDNGRMRPGDWSCGSCGANVFASKMACFRCGAAKPREGERGGALTHSHFSALTVKNAVCDRLRDQFGTRPSVDADDADLPLFLHVHRGRASLYRVLSGGASMHKRGYRTGSSVHAAALRETLAAAMLLHAGYDPAVDVLCDPMAGSGTIPIEAALIAQRIAPGLLRPPPALTRWPDFDMRSWAAATEEAEGMRLERAPCPILGNDWHPGASELASRAASAAGVVPSIAWQQSDAYVSSGLEYMQTPLPSPRPLPTARILCDLTCLGLDLIDLNGLELT